MQAHNPSHVVSGLDWYEMGRLCQTVHYYPDRVITSTSAGQTDYKVHSDLIPFPLRNLQWLQQTYRSLMFLLELALLCKLIQLGSEMDVNTV
jgi:hypothetical protein